MCFCAVAYQLFDLEHEILPPFQIYSGIAFLLSALIEMFE